MVWWYHFVEFGDTPAKARTEMNYKNSVYIRGAGTIIQDKVKKEDGLFEYIITIVENEPDLYFDKIQEQFTKN